VLLPLYPDPDTRQKLLDDPQTAPIPNVQKEMFAFTKRFVQESWDMRPQDLDRLRAAGLSEAEVVNWATLGSTQSWFTMSADGGGIPMEQGALTGPGVGKLREHYEATPEGQLAPSLAEGAGRSQSADGIAWVETNEGDPAYVEAARWAEERYGFVPNLLRAVSLQPNYYKRHCLALELLEKPQSEQLSPRQHALVRALVSQLTRSAYGQVTARALLERVTGETQIPETLSDADRVVLDFATKVARNAYKITEKDAAAFRDAGLGDEAYVDVLNTTSIQISLERLANCLGVRPDEAPALPRS
jgi:alkylhydroperoxidase family enzyme